MSAPVLLKLLNELGKRDKMRGMSSVYFEKETAKKSLHTA